MLPLGKIGENPLAASSRCVAQISVASVKRTVILALDKKALYDFVAAVAAAAAEVQVTEMLDGYIYGERHSLQYCFMGKRERSANMFWVTYKLVRV